MMPLPQIPRGPHVAFHRDVDGEPPQHGIAAEGRFTGRHAASHLFSHERLTDPACPVDNGDSARQHALDDPFLRCRDAAEGASVYDAESSPAVVRVVVPHHNSLAEPNTSWVI